MNGYIVVVSDKYSSIEQGSFELEQSSDGISWTKLMYLPWRYQTDLQSVLVSPKTQKIVDLRVPWTWVLRCCLGEVFLALGYLASSFLGLAGQGRSAFYSLSTAYLLFSCTNMVAALAAIFPSGRVGSIGDGGPAAAANCALISLFSLLLASEAAA